MNKNGSLKFQVLSLGFLVALLFSLAGVSYAQIFESASFKANNPVIAPGNYSTSTNFRLNSTLYQIGIGTSSVTSFGVNSGFLFYPYVTTPALSATPGVQQASLSWTAATGFLGWTVSSYKVGQATVSGGPYSYTSLGNTTSHTATSLTAGTTYYFVVVARDAFSNDLSTSTQSSAVPTAPSTPPPSGGGGGGGGGTYVSSGTVNFSGRAYPRSIVTILKDAQVSTTAIAGSDGAFSTGVTNLSSGNYFFSVYSEDKDGRRSNSLTFPTSVTAGATTNITGIFVAPTIATDKSEVKKGDDIVIFGQSAPQAEILITVNSDEEFFVKANSDKDGVYLYNFNSSPLEYGDHRAKSKAALNNNQIVSIYSSLASFKVGTKNTNAKAPTKCPAKADLNSDCRVNLVDFSIAAFWYKRSLSSAFLQTEKDKLNGDGKVTLTDFSIMAYYWTG